MSVRISSFNAIHSVIKTYVSQRSGCRNGVCQKWQYLIFGYFSTKLGTSVDGHEKNINLNGIEKYVENKLHIK
jgi:hypothetical protein